MKRSILVIDLLIGTAILARAVLAQPPVLPAAVR